MISLRPPPDLPQVSDQFLEKLSNLGLRNILTSQQDTNVNHGSTMLPTTSDSPEVNVEDGHTSLASSLDRLSIERDGTPTKEAVAHAREEQIRNQACSTRRLCL